MDLEWIKSILWWGDGIPLILGILALMLVWVSVADARRKRKFRTAFVADHKPLTDEEFLRRVGAPQRHREVCLWVRRTLAAGAGVPADLVGPDDSLVTLMEHTGFDGADYLDVVFRLEKALGVRIRRPVFEKALPPDPRAATVGDFGARLGEVLEKEGLLDETGSSGEKGVAR